MQSAAIFRALYVCAKDQHFELGWKVAELYSVLGGARLPRTVSLGRDSDCQPSAYCRTVPPPGVQYQMGLRVARHCMLSFARSADIFSFISELM